MGLRKIRLKRPKVRSFMAHQQRAYEFLEEHKGCGGLFLSPGTGKTLIVIRYIVNNELAPNLLISRRDDFLTWYTELEEEGYDLTKIIKLDKSRKLNRAIKSMQEDPDRFVMVTYDLLKNDRVFSWVRSVLWKVAITDESHMIKHWDTKRTKKVVKATRHVPARMALSGSPITNDPGDVFAQAYFYDNGKTFGDNYWRFRNRYYIHNKDSHGWYLRSGSKVLISKKLAQSAFYVDEDDVLKLPKKRSLIKSAPMSKIQQKYFNQALSEWEVELGESNIIEFDDVLAQISKLRQIGSGFLYVTDEDSPKERETIWFDSCKLDLLKELLTSPEYLKNKPKVVIWCAFTAEILKIKEMADKLKIGAVTFYGSKSKEKERARKRFKNDESIKLFIGQVESGVGMNELIVADNAVYYSNSPKVVARQQSMRRIRRKGSEIHKQITYWDLVAEGSLDLHILKSVQHSMSVARSILERLKKGERIRQIIAA
jgi:hypothetical protein